MGWIGVDLDGTLAEWDGVWRGPDVIGIPIPRMVERVKKWLAEGKDVRIFTARINGPNISDNAAAKFFIEDWTFEHLGANLKVTFAKDHEMEELWDDRAIQVEKNTGRRVDDLHCKECPLVHYYHEDAKKREHCI